MKFELSVLALVATVANAQGAPGYDKACLDWGLYFSMSEAGESCRTQLEAMDAYCEEDDKKPEDSRDIACLEYGLAIFGYDVNGDPLVMRKSMLAAKKSLIKRTGAPTLDYKCFDWGLYTDSTDEAIKCRE